MEKMETGFNPNSANWRFTMILPEGNILGSTKGENSDNVAFCSPCHADAGESFDHLFFVPKSYRATFETD